MARTPKKPDAAAELPVLTEVPENEGDLPVLTEVPDAEPDLPVLTEVLADETRTAEPAPTRKAAPASPPSAGQQSPEPPPSPAAAGDAKPQTIQLTDEQLRKIAAYVAPEVEKLLRRKVSKALDALWPKIWAEAEAELPEMIRNIIIDLARHTRK